MKNPEALIDTVYRDFGGTAPVSFTGHHALKHDHRSRSGHFARKLLSKELRAGDHGFGFSETREYQFAQARADRFAHQQRSSKHGHRGRNAEHHREVRPPIVSQVARDQYMGSHTRLIDFPTARRDQLH